MNPALWVGKTGLEAQNTRLSVLSNNLANVSTNGFKRSRAVFEDLLYQNVRQVGALTSQNTQLPSGLLLGTGVRTVATQTMHLQGNLLQTSSSFDLAVQGRGFFQIALPDGTTAYTRDGSFQIDSQGRLVTASGYPVQPGINIPENHESFSVGRDGVVSILEPGAIDPIQIGNIQTADFINPTGLQPIGENLFRETAASGPPQVGDPGLNGLGILVQGSLEGSNVNVAEEMVNMIETQRAYEMNTKVISTADQMLQNLTNQL